jgi:hypothetical protein
MDTIFNKDTQDKLAVPLLEGNLAYLEKNGVPTTPGWAYMSWYIGMGGATAIWKAIQNGNGNKKVGEILDAAKINWGPAVNPELGAETFKGGMENTASNFPVLLENRLKKQGGLHMTPQGVLTIGGEINAKSVENADMKKDMAQTPGGVVIMQQNNNNTTQTTNVISPKRQDNTNPILR